jgi:hypothetical protein
MSMTPEQQNFEELRRLLSLKRHEQPPPGYFNNFSRHVIARIKAGESAAADSFMQRLFARLPWLQGMWGGFEAKPILAGAFGVGVCGLLVVGLVSSERMDTTAGGLGPNGEPQKTILANVPDRTGLFDRVVGDPAPTGTVFTARSSIFDEIRPHAQSAIYYPPFPAN